MTPAPETLFHALSDPTRLRILALLTAEDELCVCELTHALGLSQPMISRHLAQLRASELASDRRSGQWIYYRLHPKLPKWARSVLAETLAGIVRGTPYRSDIKALRSMRGRPSNRCV
jgi:ArsR family transcriptional regulator